MKKKKLLKIILLSLTIILVNFKSVNADVGSFDSYDSGGSDWSSSSSDWGSSSSWSSSSSDWGSSSSWDSGSYDSEGGGSILGLVWLFSTEEGKLTLIIILLIIIVTSLIKKHGRRIQQNDPLYNVGKQNVNVAAGTVYTTNVHDVPQTHIYAEKIKEIDPMFSEEKFLGWAKDLYVKLQHAWTEREWEEMRPFETEELFEQHSAQLQEYIKNNTINVVDRIAVNYATIYGFRQTEDKDIVEVALKATKKDYIIDETTREVVEGNKDQYRITVYKMTFERTKGKLTEEGTDDLDARNCPNCGAPLNITSAGRCEYCGSIVTTGVHDWVLSGLEPLRKEY